MNQSIIFVGVGLLAALALFMVQSKGLAAGPQPRGRLPSVEPITPVSPKDSTPPVPRGPAIPTGSGRPTAPINVLGDPEVKAIATKTGYIPPTYQVDYQ